MGDDREPLAYKTATELPENIVNWIEAHVRNLFPYISDSHVEVFASSAVVVAGILTFGWIRYVGLQRVSKQVADLKLQLLNETNRGISKLRRENLAASHYMNHQQTQFFRQLKSEYKNDVQQLQRYYTDCTNELKQLISTDFEKTIIEMEKLHTELSKLHVKFASMEDLLDQVDTSIESQINQKVECDKGLSVFSTKNIVEDTS